MMKNKYILYVAGIAMVTLFVVGLWSMKTKKEELENPTPQTAKEQGVTKTDKTGSVTLKLPSAEEPLRVGEPTKVSIVADAIGAAVTDFDVIVGFSSTAFKVGNVASLLSNYSLVPYQQGGVLSITGFKSVATKKSEQIAGTAVAEFTITPQSAGTYTLYILDKSGTGTTKFIGENGTAYFPEVSTINVSVTQ